MKQENNKSKLHISPITLGTVQLGIKYGIANKKGALSDDEVEEILSHAWESGITSYDTAPAYGESERRIGDFIKKEDFSQSNAVPCIITKFSPITHDENTTEAVIYSQIEKSLKKSLNTLHLQKIPILLLHKAQDMNDKRIISALQMCKQQGFVEKIGVSIYTPQDVQDFLNMNVFDVIQIPINIFDHRLIKSGLLDELKKRNVIVFARSVFLQGLFYMQPKELPPNLDAAKVPLQNLIEFSHSKKIPIGTLAFSFVRDLPGINSIVMGVDTKAQLQENLTLLNSPRLSNSDMQEIISLFNDIPEKIVDPSKWNK